MTTNSDTRYVVQVGALYLNRDGLGDFNHNTSKCFTAAEALELIRMCSICAPKLAAKLSTAAVMAYTVSKDATGNWTGELTKVAA